MDKQFEMEVDASGFAVGAVLMQRQEDGKRHPVGFYSATLNDAERNYDIYDLELLAVVKSLENWRVYLAGSPHKVIVFTDHMNLQYWRDPHKISRRVARQVLRLAEYDIELRHIPGKTNGRADALSRLPNYNQGDEDNENVTVLPDHLFARLALAEDHEEQDEDILRPWVDPHNLREITGVWWKDGRRVVTGDLAYRRQVVHDHHDLPAYGHPGVSRTIRLVEHHYWWPQMRQEIRDYVSGCADCQRNKVNTQAKKAPLTPIFPQPEALPFEMVAMDFIIKLPLSDGYNSILTVTDHDCTKAALFIPCNETITAEGLAELYLQHVFKRFGLPKKIISDQDPRIAGKFTRALCTALGIAQNISTAFHPRTDRQSEWTNQGLEQYLCFYVDDNQGNWAWLLTLAEFAHNSWHNESTGQSPFELLMGYMPRAEWTPSASPIPQVTLRLEQITEARTKARNAMIKAQQGWERRKRNPPVFQDGDQVWLDGRNIKMYHPTAKLAPKRHGPFNVTRVLSPITYELSLPTQWKLHPVFHVDLLTPYKETEFHGANYDKPPPDLVDGEEEYEVERIVTSRRFGRGRKLQYLIKWKGYPDSDNQWVDAGNVFAEEAIWTFRDSHPERRGHIRRLVSEEIPHPLSGECHVLGLDRNRSLKSSSTSTPESLAVTSSSAFSTTSPISTEENTHISVASASVCTTTSHIEATPMVIVLDNVLYRSLPPPSTSYVNTLSTATTDIINVDTDDEDTIEDPLIPEASGVTRIETIPPAVAEEDAVEGLVRPTAGGSRDQVAVSTDGTPITRAELAGVLRRFPSPVKEAVRTPEPESLGFDLRHETTGAVCNNRPLMQAEVNQLRNALPSGPRRPSPGPLPVRPRIGTALTMAGGSSQVARAATTARSGSTSGAAAESGRVQENAGRARSSDTDDLFPAEHPFIRLEHGCGPDDTPHVCSTDGTPLFKGNIHSALLHASQPPSAPRRRTHPDQPPYGFIRNIGSHYIPFVTTHDDVTRQVDFIQTILTSDPLIIGLRLDTDFVFAKPIHATPKYMFGDRPIYGLDDLEVLDEKHADRGRIERELDQLNDVTVRAEVIRYRALTADVAYLEGRLMDLEKQWGEITAKKLGCIQRLEMASVLERLTDVHMDIIDVEG